MHGSVRENRLGSNRSAVLKPNSLLADCLRTLFVSLLHVAFIRPFNNITPRQAGRRRGHSTAFDGQLDFELMSKDGWTRTRSGKGYAYQSPEPDSKRFKSSTLVVDYVTSTGKYNNYKRQSTAETSDSLTSSSKAESLPGKR